MTDWGTLYAGAFIDNIRVTSGIEILLNETRERLCDLVLRGAVGSIRRVQRFPRVLPAVAQRHRHWRLRRLLGNPNGDSDPPIPDPRLVS